MTILKSNSAKSRRPKDALFMYLSILSSIPCNCIYLIYMLYKRFLQHLIDISRCDCYVCFALLQVSWIRHRDIHILTVGSYTYTSDQRFQATHHQDTDDWTLQIKWAQKRDAGMYECQISTQPVRSYFVRLNVVGEYVTVCYCVSVRTSVWIALTSTTTLAMASLSGFIKKSTICRK